MKLFSILALFAISLPAFALATFNDAAAAFEHGDFGKAEAVLHQLLEAQPNDASALGLLGAVLDEEKKFTEAGSVYQQAIRLNSHSATLLNNYANHELATGDTAGARVTYLKVIAIDPARANANVQLAKIAVAQKKGAEALGYLEHISATDRAAPQVQILTVQSMFLAGRMAEAANALAALGKSSDPRLQFSLGLALAEVNRFANAENAFSRALESVPANFDILYNLGLAAYHAHHLERARSALEAALSERPQDADTLYNLAAVDIDLKDREKALALLVEAARLDPSRANVQLAVAQTASSLGFYADALIAYEKYLQVAPNDVSAQRERLFLIALARDPRLGLAELQNFSRSHPKDVTAHYEIGLLEAKTDPPDAALHFKEALTLDPDFIPARFGRGVMNFLQSNYAAALPDLEFAASHYPGNSIVLDRLGEDYLALDRPADAVRALERASQLAPKDARVLMHLSRALSKDGQTAEARATLARFRAVGPQPGNLIPQAGLLDFLNLSPEEQEARYSAELKKRYAERADDPDLAARYLKLLLNENRAGEIPAVAAHLLDLKPPAPTAADAGHALIEAEQFAEAKPLLEYATAASPEPAWQLDLALALFHTGGATAGLKELDKIPEAKRSGDYYLARAEMLDANGNPQEALTAMRNAIRAAPTRLDLYAAAASFLDRHGESGEAVALLDHAPAASIDNPRMLVLKAEVLASAGRGRDAEQLLKTVHNRWPEWAPAYVLYGILLEKEGHAAEAKSELDTAQGLGVSPAQIESERLRLRS